MGKLNLILLRFTVKVEVRISKESQQISNYLCNFAVDF